jgi:DNA-binding LytR/AlgR family response regulator
MILKPFFIWQNKVLKRIDPLDVMCLSTEKNYTKVVLSDKSIYMVRTTLASAIKKLPPDMFIKISRSVIASIYFIDDIVRDHLVVDGLPIPIGKGFYKSVINQLTILE